MIDCAISDQSEPFAVDSVTPRRVALVRLSLEG
jgi:hypothetical protein